MAQKGEKPKGKMKNGQNTARSREVRNNRIRGKDPEP